MTNKITTLLTGKKTHQKRDSDSVRYVVQPKTIKFGIHSFF